MAHRWPPNPDGAHRTDDHPGDDRTTGLRFDGTADINASRTTRRWVNNRRANSRIDTADSSRRALRICSNNSTFDLFVIGPPFTDRTPPRWTRHVREVGPNQAEHNPLRWGQNR